jgi:FSR family fosmidomycin resistance protein-like MFS transporter
MLKQTFGLSFRQIGLITLVSQITASLLQPVIGVYTDRRPQSHSLAVGMAFTLVGMMLLGFGPGFSAVLAAAALIGLGSAVFHPESSRIARLASGGRHGFAQAFFQVGGNLGSAVGPLLAAFLVLPYGRHSIAWFSLAALVGIIFLWNVGNWYKRTGVFNPAASAKSVTRTSLTRRQTRGALAVLLGLIFSKYIYLASFGSYYTFYLMSRFHLSVRSAQIHLFLFLGAVAAGTIFGGPIGDRFGRRRVILWSILGVLPFSLAPRLRLLGHHRVCAGARPRARGHDLGPVLRLRLRHCRRRRRRARGARRPNQHLDRVPGVLVFAGNWRAGILAAADRASLDRAEVRELRAESPPLSRATLPPEVQR